MLTLDDCIALCDLTEEEIEAIMEHEHVPEIVAVEMAQYLVGCPDGASCLKRIILDDIAAAEARGDGEHAWKLRMVLRHFIRTHPGLVDKYPAVAGRQPSPLTKRAP
ncbi:MAG: hypothetical protein WD100_05220 [Tistlia sp.]|uniref:hypothetical protein n=1 Tax=Tistlia sp. TaxID=3057121 RepID=UPI0034A52600